MDKMNLITRKPEAGFTPVRRTPKKRGDYEYIYDHKTGQHVARLVAAKAQKN